MKNGFEMDKFIEDMNEIIENSKVQVLYDLIINYFNVYIEDESVRQEAIDTLDALIEEFC